MTPAAARPFRRFLSLALFGGVAAGAAVLSAPSVAVAQQAQLRIAVVNPARVVAAMDEMAAMKAQDEQEGKRLEQQSREKGDAIQKLTKERDDTFAPGSPQYEDTTNEINRMTAEFKVWVETQKVRRDTQEKRRTKQLFDRVQAAVSKVAARDGIDLVIADVNQQLPADLSRVTMTQVQALTFSKVVLFQSNKPGLDITETVIASVNAEYKQGGGAAPAVVNPVAPK